MSKALRLFAIAVIGCVAQTVLAQYIQIADVAPDIMIAMIVALTSFCGLSGCFCVSALMIMFYDASVGYVMALNPIAYILIALAAAALRLVFNAKLSKWKHKSFLIIMVICFFLTLCREITYAAYLFLIGAELTMMTLARMFLCSGYTTLMTIPCIYLIRAVMKWHPLKRKKTDPDIDEPIAAMHQ